MEYITESRTGQMPLCRMLRVKLTYTILYGIVGLIGSFEYGPQGLTGGLVKYYGEALCTNYSPPSDLGAAGKWTATFQVTGAVSRTTW